MPKFSTDQLKAELARLEGAGFSGAEFYLKAELKRRRNTTGKRATNDSPTHQAWRRASAKYREKKLSEERETRIKTIREMEAEGLRLKENLDS